MFLPMQGGNLEHHLRDCVGSGATITFRDGTTLPLADAFFLSPGRLWYCLLWPENDFAQHWLTFRKVTSDSGMLLFTEKKGALTVIAPMEDGERDQWKWDAWQHATHLHRFVADLADAAKAGCQP